MSHALLKTIDDHFSNVLESEMESPTIDLAPSERSIAGFDIPDDEFARRRNETARAARREKVAGYYRVKAELAEILGDLGVKPLAYLPSRAFEKMARDASLIFVPESMRTEVNPTHFLAWMATGSDSFGADQDRARMAHHMLKPSNRTVQQYMDAHPRELIMRHLLTLDGVDLVPGRDDLLIEILREKAELGNDRAASWLAGGGITGRPQASRIDARKYGIRLPVPPAEVHDSIRRVSSLSPRTVAVPGAISFSETTLEAVLFDARGDFLRRVQEAEARADWMLNDPIVYVQRGSVTAVIAQFGPFPIEMEMVERIKASHFLPV